MYRGSGMQFERPLSCIFPSYLGLTSSFRHAICSQEVARTNPDLGAKRKGLILPEPDSLLQKLLTD